MENLQRIVTCVCGAQHLDYRPCMHGEAEVYQARFQTPQGDGIETGVIGPEGNRIPLSRKVFEEAGIRHYWVDTMGRAHPQTWEPYRDIEEYTAEDFVN